MYLILVTNLLIKCTKVCIICSYMYYAMVSPVWYSSIKESYKVADAVL